MSLKTDYKDYELAPSMGGQRHYRVTENADGTQSLTDVSEYLEIGDSFKAEDINATNSAVNDLANTPNDVTDLKMLGWTVPKEMPIKNYTDSNGVYHQRVGRVDMDSLSWEYNSSNKAWLNRTLNSTIKKTSTSDEIPNVYINNYETTSVNGGYAQNKKCVYVRTDGLLFVNNLSSTTQPSGYLYYELATEITKSVDGNEATTYPFDGAGCHNGIYRGKYLGSSVTAQQYSAIRNGTFKDLFIGDYWTIGGVNYRIAAFDYYLNSGNTSCTTHHAVIVTDTVLYNYVMNDSNVTTNGYVGSKMYTEGLEQAKTTIRNAFGTANILTHRGLLTNTTSGNRATIWSWYDSDIELMNESMVYGNPVGSKAVDNSINFNVGIDKSQLPLFALSPSRITNRAAWWLRCVVSSSSFAAVDSGGTAAFGGASNTFGVRPYFCIK